jgi:hypothetical protein
MGTEWKPGQHVSIFGPTGAGKTTVAVELIEATDTSAVLLVTKSRDRLISDLERRGWTVCRSFHEVRKLASNRRSFSERMGYGPPRGRVRVVYWPHVGGTIRQRRSQLSELMQEACDWALHRGQMTLAIDEALYAVEDLKLAPELRTLWHEGRSSGVSLLACSQRPAWLPKSAYSSPTYFALFRTSDPDDLKRLADIGGGLDTERLRLELRLLDRHELCFVLPREQPPEIVRTRAQVRKPRTRA